MGNEQEHLYSIVNMLFYAKTYYFFSLKLADKALENQVPSQIFQFEVYRYDLFNQKQKNI